MIIRPTPCTIVVFALLAGGAWRQSVTAPRAGDAQSAGVSRSAVEGQRAGTGQSAVESRRDGEGQRAGDAQESAGDGYRARDGGEVVARGSLAEVRNGRRIALLVSKSLVVDARDPALGALEDYRKALMGSPPRPHVAAYRQLAQKLNKYIRKYRSTTAAASVAEADFIIVFRVAGQRASVIPGDPFVWGKMYVLAVAGERGPRVVWESEGDISRVEDATGDFIKALKTVRGEK
jgi:hypothetical protein